MKLKDIVDAVVKALGKQQVNRQEFDNLSNRVKELEEQNKSLKTTLETIQAAKADFDKKYGDGGIYFDPAQFSGTGGKDEKDWIRIIK